MQEPTPVERSGWLDRLSILALIAAVIIGGYVAYTTRPWEGSSQADTEIGLVGGDANAPRPGEQAPDFILPRADGSQLQLSGLEGTPVFLNFWATWCTFCLEEMPDMQRIADEFDGQIVVLGLNAGDSVADGTGYVERLGVSYELVYDMNLDVTEGYRVRAMPTSYFISADGTIVDAHFGFLSYNDMLNKVNALLEQDG